MCGGGVWWWCDVTTSSASRSSRANDGHMVIRINYVAGGILYLGWVFSITVINYRLCSLLNACRLCKPIVGQSLFR